MSIVKEGIRSRGEEQKKKKRLRYMKIEAKGEICREDGTT
jgi:hypothetical protein